MSHDKSPEAYQPTKSPRFETVLDALRRGERDAQLLDGRYFDKRYWQNARRQLTTLRRELTLVEGERDAFRAVVDGWEQR